MLQTGDGPCLSVANFCDRSAIALTTIARGTYAHDQWHNGAGLCRDNRLNGDQ